MIDNGKVIEGLEYIVTAYALHGEDDKCIGDAIELLKEQESVEPMATDSGVRIEYNCGSCGRWFCFKSKIHPEMDFRTRYCPHCGRKAKW